MEIKVGEYVRTKNGYIGYVENINDFREPSMKYAIEMQKSDLVFVGEEDIKSHSTKIIDLIEVGDYANGYKVIDIVKGYKVIIDKLELDTTTGTYKNIGIKDIKSILAHEQFEDMEYKV